MPNRHVDSFKSHKEMATTGKTKYFQFPRCCGKANEYKKVKKNQIKLHQYLTPSTISYRLNVNMIRDDVKGSSQTPAQNGGFGRLLNASEEKCRWKPIENTSTQSQRQWKCFIGVGDKIEGKNDKRLSTHFPARQKTRQTPWLFLSRLPVDVHIPVIVIAFIS